MLWPMGAEHQQIILQKWEKIYLLRATVELFAVKLTQKSFMYYGIVGLKYSKKSKKVRVCIFLAYEIV